MQQSKARLKNARVTPRGACRTSGGVSDVLESDPHRVPSGSLPRGPVASFPQAEKAGDPGAGFSRDAVPAEQRTASSRLDLAIVLPTFNERENVGELVVRLEKALGPLSWELVFVDDDSPDGTAGLIAGWAARDPRIRLLHRVGRRGLSSACIEGILATSAPCVAVMDTDLQHDETILPDMLERLRNDCLDVVIGTRNAAGGSMGDFARSRVFMSQLGRRIGEKVCHCPLTDPMSGFFMVERSFFLEVVHRLHGGGFKILVDILASSEHPIRFAEVGYCFRNRQRGQSKLDANAALEYVSLIINKLTRGAFSTRLATFSLVGATGVFTYIACLLLLVLRLHRPFVIAQAVATFAVILDHFLLNNLITTRSLRGMAMLRGLLFYSIACSCGGWASLVFTHALQQQGWRWYLAGFAGIVFSSVWNFFVSNLFTWQMPRSSPASIAPEIVSVGEMLESTH